MLQKLILFLRDIARQNYESFVVYGDTSDINMSNMRLTEADIQAGYFWDRQWFCDRDMNKLSVTLPCLGLERASRTLFDEHTVKDTVWITLTTSEQADTEQKRHVNDPTKTWSFEELSKIMATVLETDLVLHIPTGRKLILHKSQYEGNLDFQPTRFGIFTQEEPLELIWLNTQDRTITVGCKISFDDCAAPLILEYLEPLPTDLAVIPLCC